MTHSFHFKLNSFFIQFINRIVEFRLSIPFPEKSDLIHRRESSQEIFRKSKFNKSSFLEDSEIVRVGESPLQVVSGHHDRHSVSQFGRVEEACEKTLKFGREGLIEEEDLRALAEGESQCSDLWVSSFLFIEITPKFLELPFELVEELVIFEFMVEGVETVESARREGRRLVGSRTEICASYLLFLSCPVDCSTLIWLRNSCEKGEEESFTGSVLSK